PTLANDRSDRCCSSPHSLSARSSTCISRSMSGAGPLPEFDGLISRSGARVLPSGAAGHRGELAIGGHSRDPVIEAVFAGGGGQHRLVVAVERGPGTRAGQGGLALAAEPRIVFAGQGLSAGVDHPIEAAPACSAGSW